MTTESKSMSQGRPTVYSTNEERLAARKASSKKARIKHRIITLDKDLVDQLSAIADKLSTELGFRPTYSQTLRHLLKKHDH